MFRVESKADSLTVLLFDRPVIRHGADLPFVSVAESSEPAGGFVTAGRSAPVKYIPLAHAQFDEKKSVLSLSGGKLTMNLHLELRADNLVITPQRASVEIGRAVFSFPASGPSGAYGCGAGDSPHIRGATVPVWVRDPGAGPNVKKGFRLWRRNAYSENNSFTQPSFVTDSKIFVHVDTYNYCEISFGGSRRNRVETWGIPERIIISAAPDYELLYKRVSGCLGRPPLLPGWSLGTLVGVSGGTSRMAEMLKNTLRERAKVKAVLLRDWSGGVDTPSGRHTFWDWTWNSTLYPKLDEILREIREQGVHALAYVNPHMAIEGCLFAEAARRGFLIKRQDGSNYVSDMGGFTAGHLDLTNPDAAQWYKATIAANVIDFGFSGYVADMGSYLPADAVLNSGESPLALHNKWPVLWAKLNRELIHESPRRDEIMFVSNTGFSGSMLHSMLVSPANEGLRDMDVGQALRPLLSLSYTGVGIAHAPVSQSADSIEQFMRFVEFAAFQPIMRTEDFGFGAEFDRDSAALGHFARMSRIHMKMEPYLRHCVEQCAETGVPVIRPLSMAYPDEKPLRRIDDEYLLGAELLVAPVIKPEAKSRRVVFPTGRWVHFWTGKEYGAGEEHIEAPLGQPPVFFRRDARHSDLFIFLD